MGFGTFFRRRHRGTLKNNKGKDEKNGKCGTIEVKSGVITTTSIGGVEGSAASGSLSSGDGGTAWIDTGSMNADMKEFTSGIVFSEMTDMYTAVIH